MASGQVLPRAATSTFVQGNWHGTWLFASPTDTDVVILSSALTTVQVLLRGYYEKVFCVAWGPDGKLAVATSAGVYVYFPRVSSPPPILERTNMWELVSEIRVGFDVHVMCWGTSGTTLVVGGESAAMFQLDLEDGIDGRRMSLPEWRITWRHASSSPIKMISFAADARFFATVAEGDSNVKLWYRSDSDDIDFLYLSHPAPVTGISFYPGRKSDLSQTACLLTMCEDGVVRLWSETGPREPLGFFMCRVVDNKMMFGAGGGRVSWLSQKLIRTPLGGRHPLMIHGHDSDTDSSCRQFYSSSSVSTQDFLLGVGSDGSVMLWLVERMGNQPRSYPNCYIRATLPAGSLPTEESQKVVAVYDDVTEKIVHGISVITPSNVFVYSQWSDYSISSHRLMITHNSCECVQGTRQFGHSAAVRQIATHRTLPLTASRAQDGSAFVWNTSPSLLVEATPVMTHLFTLPSKCSALCWFPSEPYIALSTLEGIAVYGVEHFHDVYRFQQSSASFKLLGLLEGTAGVYDSLHITRMAALDESETEGFVMFAHQMGSACLTAWKVLLPTTSPNAATTDDDLLALSHALSAELLVTGDVVQDRGITVMSGLSFPKKNKEGTAATEAGAGFARGSFDGRMSVDVRNLDAVIAHQQFIADQRAAEAAKPNVGRQAWHLAVGCDDGHVLVYSLRPKQKKEASTGGRFNLMSQMSFSEREPEFEWEFVKLQEVTAHDSPVYDISIAHAALLSVGARHKSGEGSAVCVLEAESSGQLRVEQRIQTDSTTPFSGFYAIGNGDYLLSVSGSHQEETKAAEIPHAFSEAKISVSRSGLRHAEKTERSVTIFAQKDTTIFHGDCAPWEPLPIEYRGPAATTLGWLRDGAVLAGDGAHMAAYTRWTGLTAKAEPEKRQMDASFVSEMSEVTDDMSQQHLLVIAGECRHGRPFYHPSVLMQSVHALDLNMVERCLTHLTNELLRNCKMLESDGSFDMSALQDLEEFPATVAILPPPIRDLLRESSGELPESEEFNGTRARALNFLLGHVSVPFLERDDIAQLMGIVDSILYLRDLPAGLDDCAKRYLIAHHVNSFTMKRGQPPPRLSCSDMAWAFHSSNQEQFVDQIITPQTDWVAASALGVGYWLRNSTLCAKAGENIAKAQFASKKSPRDCAAMYLALGKKSTLLSLLRVGQEEVIFKFLSNDFTQDRWKTAGHRNAFEQMKKHNYQLAIAFFLVADGLREAVDCAIQNLKDFQLALFIARLVEGREDGPIFTYVLNDHVLPYARASGDAWLASMCYWLLKDYEQATNVLLLTPSALAESAKNTPAAEELNPELVRFSPSVPYFYQFLLGRPQVRNTKASKAQAGPYLSAAYALRHAGYPAAALRVMNLLDTASKQFKGPVKSKTPLVENRAAPQSSTSSSMESGTLGGFGGFGGMGMGGMGGMDGMGGMSFPGMGMEEAPVQKVTRGFNLLSMMSPQPEEEPAPVKMPTKFNLMSRPDPEPEPEPEAEFGRTPPLKMNLMARSQPSQSSDDYSSGLLGGGMFASFMPSSGAMSTSTAHDRRPSVAPPTTSSIPVVRDSIEDPEKEVSVEAEAAAKRLINRIKFRNALQLLFQILTRQPSWTTEEVSEIIQVVVDAFAVDGSRLLTSLIDLFVLHAEYERCVPLVRALRLRYKQDLDLTDVESQIRTQAYGDAITHSVALAAAMLPISEGGIGSLTQARNVLAAARFLVDQHRLNSSMWSPTQQAGVIAAINTSLLYCALYCKQFDTLRILLNMIPSGIVPPVLRKAQSAFDVRPAQQRALSQFRHAQRPLSVAVVGGMDFAFAVGGGEADQENLLHNTPMKGQKAPPSPVLVHRPSLDSALPTAVSDLLQQFHFPERIVSKTPSADDYDSAGEDDSEATRTKTIWDEEEFSDDEDQSELETSALDTEAASERARRREMALHPFVELLSVWYLASALSGHFSQAMEADLGQSVPAVSLLEQRASRMLSALKVHVQRHARVFRLGLRRRAQEDQPSLGSNFYNVLPSNSHLPLFSDDSEQQLWEFLSKRSALDAVFEVVQGDIGLALPVSNPESMKYGDASASYMSKDLLRAFCINRSDPTQAVVASTRGMKEVDCNQRIYVQAPPSPLPSGMGGRVNSSPGGLAVQTDLAHSRSSLSARSTPMSTPGRPVPPVLPSRRPEMVSKPTPVMPMAAPSQSRGLARMEDNIVNCLASHPTLPRYLSGSSDGAIHVWQFGESEAVAKYRDSGARVTSIHFNRVGDKFGATDASGALALYRYQDHGGVQPYQIVQCHSNRTSDFAFINYGSFVATCGKSEDRRNFCLWDMLLPPQRAMVGVVAGASDGGNKLAYAPLRQLLLCGTHTGQALVYDVRQRCVVKTFTAHRENIKALSISDDESHFITGSTDGDMKVWSLDTLSEVSTWPQAHPRQTFFRAAGGDTVSTYGVTEVRITSDSVFSCGADGRVLCRPRLMF